jgi:small-conductance mechanosensitive channel
MRITIEIDTDADPSTVLDLAQEAAESLVRDLKDHGERAGLDEETGVSVSD